MCMDRDFCWFRCEKICLHVKNNDSKEAGVYCIISMYVYAYYAQGQDSLDIVVCVCVCTWLNKE
jgi:hypothetical protein